MLEKLDPFRGIFETKRFPHARTLRTTFGQKVQDAFFVLAGDLWNTPDKSHAGLLDFITVVPIFYFLHLLVLKFFNLKSTAAKVLLAIPMLIPLVLEAVFLLARYLITAVLMVPSLIVIGAVWLISGRIAAKIKEKLSQSRMLFNGQDEEGTEQLNWPLAAIFERNRVPAGENRNIDEDLATLEGMQMAINETRTEVMLAFNQRLGIQVGNVAKTASFQHVFFLTDGVNQIERDTLEALCAFNQDEFTKDAEDSGILNLLLP